jgi:hypothetical protein
MSNIKKHVDKLIDEGATEVILKNEWECYDFIGASGFSTKPIDGFLVYRNAKIKNGEKKE